MCVCDFMHEYVHLDTSACHYASAWNWTFFTCLLTEDEALLSQMVTLGVIYLLEINKQSKGLLSNGAKDKGGNSMGTSSMLLHKLV